ncbi:MAG TPA: alpha/beta family hydrolase [Gemmatimonadales bacterium]|nr:alpha/beta family hydrolase [Gemmatimonadales bacterium]
MADREPESLRFDVGGRKVSGLWTAAADARAVAILAHGAGAGMEHPFMQGAAGGLTAAGVTAFRFNFPYAEEGRRSPDRPGTLREAWIDALDEAAAHADGLPLVASGKSMGGRIVSMIAAERGKDFAARALVFFGYPLHAPGRVDKPRDEHLPFVRVPMLFIQGTEDSLANFAMIRTLVERLQPWARLHTLQGADHSFRVRGRRRPDDDIGRELGGVAAEFIREVVG